MEEREIEIHSTTNDLKRDFTEAVKTNIPWFTSFIFGIFAIVLAAFAGFIIAYFYLVVSGKNEEIIKGVSLVFSHLSGWIVSIGLVIKDYYKEKNRTI